MPGRDKLVQENISRANSSSGSGSTTVDSSIPTSQSTAGTAPILSSHRTLMGANLDIVEALNLMEFSNATPLGDGGLRNSTAVIRRWSRQGTADVGTIPQSSTSSISFPTTTEVKSPLAYTTSSLGGTAEPYSGSFPTELPFSPTQIFSPVPSGGSVGGTLAGSGTIPITNEPPSTAQSSVVEQSANTPGSAAIVASSSGAPGAVKPANPSGIVYSGVFTNQGNRGIQSKVGTLAPRQWQFLFNPSELELVAGPEYKAAETWGVSDKANSGQPLHWTHNKNAQLKFNSVLLNGYVFGRQVEELEQGLIDLFMARDGAGQHGPDVLEFVWGRRVFGPCVIKDISIKEKMWDEGMVVNAELSFTLEQIPEWTINDGYVDVARPGRLPLIYDSTELQTPPQRDNTGAGIAESGTPDQKSTGKESTKPQSSQFDFKQCKRVQSDKNLCFQIARQIQSISDSGSLAFTAKDAGKYREAESLYQKQILDKYLKSPTYKPYFTPKYIPDVCLSPSRIAYNYNYVMNSLSKTEKEKYDYDRSLILQLKACTESIGGPGGPIDALYRAKGCNRFQTNPASNIERLY